eukprot:CAMPEP_0201516024 /NCGR_PEP_ID=MMETSP0161_2-20130828/7447_1 /ASSEMBLY_ACC=CAM_ASM_000251 /TAXON_ID=180227 /ORGANISM="Neoparamoeba aestuarina, Strain SoJaBio B1-5/56/2" /LENGTH=178 /DNA_ID=CAMNT_0047913009 /DNA_START=147 /DNA_END=680 /DNA_ORIENTATION=+
MNCEPQEGEEDIRQGESSEWVGERESGGVRERRGRWKERWEERTGGKSKEEEELEWEKDIPSIEAIRQAGELVSERRAMWSWMKPLKTLKLPGGGHRFLRARNWPIEKNGENSERAWTEEYFKRKPGGDKTTKEEEEEEEKEEVEENEEGWEKEGKRAKRMKKLVQEREKARKKLERD